MTLKWLWEWEIVFRAGLEKNGIKVRCVWTDLGEYLGEATEVKSLDQE